MVCFLVLILPSDLRDQYRQSGNALSWGRLLPSFHNHKLYSEPARVKFRISFSDSVFTCTRCGLRQISSCSHDASALERNMLVRSLCKGFRVWIGHLHGLTSNTCDHAECYRVNYVPYSPSKASRVRPTRLLAANDKKTASPRWLQGAANRQFQHIFCSPIHRKINYSVNNSPVSLPHPSHIQLCKIACNADKWNAAKKLKAGVQHRMT